MDNIKPDSMGFGDRENSFEKLLNDRALIVEPQLTSTTNNYSDVGSSFPILETGIDAISLDELRSSYRSSEDIFGVGTSEKSAVSTNYRVNYLTHETDALTGGKAVNLEAVDWQDKDDTTQQIFERALSQTFASLVKLNNDKKTLSIFRESFGENLSLKTVKNELDRLINAQAELEFTIIPQGELKANAGFASENHTIYLAEEFLARHGTDPQAVVKLLLEEIGHYFDSQLNKEDTSGDEGAIFAALVLGKELNKSRLEELGTEDDLATRIIDGESQAIEFSTDLSLNNNFASIEGQLSRTDNLNPTRKGSYSDDYLLTDVTAGQIITLELTSTKFDTYLQLINAETGKVIIRDYYSAGGGNSRLRFTAIEGIDYIARASSYNSGIVGTYQLSAKSDSPPAIVGTISAANDTVAGSLSTEDSFNPTSYGNYYIDDYQLTDVTPGEVVTLQMDLTTLDSGGIQLINADTEKIIKDKFGYGQQTVVDLSFVAVAGVEYKVRIASGYEEGTGNYQLNATSTLMDLADLTITDAVAPDVITSGEEVEVTWTVTNLGTANTTATSLFEGVYLSRDTSFNPEKDSFIGYAFNNNPIAVNDSFTLSSNIVIDGYAIERANEVNNGNNPLEGDWYLLFRTNVNDVQLESNEANNTIARQIQLNATDLEITDVVAPTSAFVGDTIPLSWTATNIGELSALGYWGDEIYLSDDENLSYEDDIYLDYGEREDYDTPLGVGESYTLSLEETTIPNIEPI
jgi:hypothetical protein